VPDGQLPFAVSVSLKAKVEIAAYNVKLRYDCEKKPKFRDKEIDLSANQLSLILLEVAIAGLIIVLLFTQRRQRKNQPAKVHGPHTPGAGYDQKEIARSKGNGMVDGGIG